MAAGLLGLVLAVNTAAAQLPVGTAFTFQGSLNLNNEPVNEPCDFEFRLFDDSVAGVQIGATQAVNNHAVTDGTFTSLLDFGAQFQGEARFLEISVRCPAGVGAFTTLNPRQELTPAPYAMGLSLPFLGVAYSNAGSVFEIVNNDMGWAATVRNNNPANTDAALNVTSMGGPAGQFLNDGGGIGLSSTVMGAADAVFATSPGGRAVYGQISSPAAMGSATAVRGENLSLNGGVSGVWGSAAGSGNGVFGETLSGRGVFGHGAGDFGYGVYGLANGYNGIGVYGKHENPNGTDPGVDGVTTSLAFGAVGVRGRAIGTGQTNPGTTYGVLGTSNAEMGVGVRGESNTGVEGEGQQYGVFGTALNIGGQGVRGEGTYGVYGLGNDGGAGVKGEAGNSSTIGVHAIGADTRLGAPALRADAGNSGVGIYALAGRAIEGEGVEFGVRGVTWDANGYGGTFTNYDANGVALHVSGKAEVAGTLQVDVLEIMGGADLAERFAFSEVAEPGMVVAIDPDQPGHMQVSREAYNTRVAGVISGANKLDAGVILGDEPESDRNLPIALSGRVWVKCDTSAKGVKAGDFLTTSDVAGHAMPVIDKDRAEGAIIGKAMTELAQGEDGMVLVLVNLQ
jgi:hypothetical protein